VAAIRANGGEATCIRMDVTRREDCTRLIQTAIDTYGQLDILLHNAAFIGFGKLLELSEDDLDRTFRAGCYAAFWLSRDALPYLEQSKAGRILVTASVAGVSQAILGLPHYSAVKQGLIGFVKGVGLELARKGITVNAVAPGLVETHHNENTPAEALERMVSGIPIPRVGKGSDIAGAYLYLASDAAAYVTGHTLVVDGGSLLGKPGELFA
jgi:3-oxoacyl-[acyl-carrier protein] reductase